LCGRRWAALRPLPRCAASPPAPRHRCDSASPSSKHMRAAGNAAGLVQTSEPSTTSSDTIMRCWRHSGVVCFHSANTVPNCALLLCIIVIVYKLGFMRRQGGGWASRDWRLDGLQGRIWTLRQRTTPIVNQVRGDTLEPCHAAPSVLNCAVPPAACSRHM